MNSYGVGRPAGLDDFVVGRAGLAVEDVLADRAAEEDRVLQHHPDMAAERLDRDVPHVAAVDADVAGAGRRRNAGIRLMIVVLPEPLGPTRATRSPGCTRNVTSRRTGQLSL